MTRDVIVDFSSITNCNNAHRFWSSWYTLLIDFVKISKHKDLIYRKSEYFIIITKDLRKMQLRKPNWSNWNMNAGTLTLSSWLNTFTLQPFSNLNVHSGQKASQDKWRVPSSVNTYFQQDNNPNGKIYRK